MAKDKFTNKWILETGIPILESYRGETTLTLRALHYRLVAAGMTNDIQHYKRVVNAMIQARWDGKVAMDAFVDHERETIGSTQYHETTVEDSVETAKQQIRNWASSYSKNLWENQPIYAEVFIEKKALQGVFEEVCRKYSIALNPCKGYPSLTFLNDAKRIFQNAINAGKEPIILYFGDYDCSGEDIPRSIKDNLERMGVEVEVRRIALMKSQVVAWKLPPAPTKSTDSRGRTWDGLGQVELDAVEPKKIIQLADKAINSVLDPKLRNELRNIEDAEEQEFKEILIRDFKELLD